MEKAMAPHSSTLAWRIPWTEEPGGLQSMGSLRVRHDWVTLLSLSCIGEGNGNPLHFLPGESQGRGSLVAAVYGVAQSRTRLKWLSSSSSSSHHWRNNGQFVTEARLDKWYPGKMPAQNQFRTRTGSGPSFPHTGGNCIWFLEPGPHPLEDMVSEIEPG